MTFAIKDGLLSCKIDIFKMFYRYFFIEKANNPIFVFV